MKYLDYAITFREFPDEIALCINITNCPHRCEGCHSPELWKDVGTELTEEELLNLVCKNKGITCVGFMGGDSNILELNKLAKCLYMLDFCNHTYKIGWYSGRSSIPKELEIELFDYIKLGPYIKELGGLDNPNTNQKFYAKGKHLHKMDANNEILYDITYKFWKNGE